MIIISYAAPENKVLAIEMAEELNISEMETTTEKVNLSDMTTFEKDKLGGEYYTFLIKIIISSALKFAIDKFSSFLKNQKEKKILGKVSIRINDDLYLQDVDLETITDEDIEKLKFHITRLQKKLKEV